MKQLVIGSRASPLALAQTELVRSRLQKIHPSLPIQIRQIVTEGDKKLATPLAEIGGKGLFLKELEQAMLDQQIDIAVHSVKDVPYELASPFRIAVVLPRADPSDAMVSNHYPNLQSLPTGARVGTCSLRRQGQMLHHYPALSIVPLRGNLNSRIEKLDNGSYDALILASAGLQRLGWHDRIRCQLELDVSVPACGQGAIGVEYRIDNDAVQKLLMPLDDPTTRLCVETEREVNRILQGSCRLPIGIHASHLTADSITLRAVVASPSGRQLIRVQGDYPPATAARTVAQKLLDQGGDKLIAAIP